MHGDYGGPHRPGDPDPLGPDDYRGCVFAAVFATLVGVLVLFAALSALE